MTPDDESELVERVAKAIRGRIELCDYCEQETTDAARAAIAVVVEEAAKVAKEFEWNLPLDDEQIFNDHADDIACEVCEQISAAIRALNPKER